MDGKILGMSKKTNKKMELAGSPREQDGRSPEEGPYTEKGRRAAEALAKRRSGMSTQNGVSSHNKDMSVVLPGDKFRDHVVEQLALGQKPADIARKLAKGNKRKAAALRKRVWHLVQQDARLAAKVHHRAHGVATVGLIPAVKGLSERAARGRPDAVKPLMEVTKFHEPRKQVEHSGEVRITMDVPRPKRVEQEMDEEVIEAVVVEEIGGPESGGTKEA